MGSIVERIKTCSNPHRRFYVAPSFGFGCGSFSLSLARLFVRCLVVSFPVPSLSVMGICRSVTVEFGFVAVMLLIVGFCGRMLNLASWR